MPKDKSNPFRFGEVVKQQEFCVRADLSKALHEIIDAGHNAVVLGERRMGKTSLMLNTAEKIRGMRVIYSQLWAVGSVEDIANRLLHGIVSMKNQKTILEKAIKAIGHLRPQLEIDPLTGQPSLTVGHATEVTPTGLHGVFDFIGEIAEQNKVVVILDEFQDIRRVENCDALLGEIRSRIQLQSGVPYLFAGSIRNDMEQIFKNPSSPFFKSFRTIDVGPLDQKRFQTFLNKRFTSGDREVEQSVYSKIFELTTGNPSDIQQFCSALWDCSTPGDNITIDDVPAALKHIFATERKGYEYLVRQLTKQQLACLRALAEVGGDHPQSKDFLAASGIKTPASVKRALQKLIKVEIVYDSDLNHKFFDPFFREWLKYGIVP